MNLSLKILSAGLVLSTISATGYAQTCPAPQPVSNMTLTFDDEFQGPTLDQSKWTTIAQGGNQRINNEQEAYVPTGVEMIPGGGLRLQAKPASFWNQSYTSGEVLTEGKFSQTYGHFEMKALMPNGDGLWPAFWMLPDNEQWPPEIDILEYIYADSGVMPGTPNTVSGAYQTVHWKDASGNAGGQGFKYYGDFGTAYHTYAMDWRPGSIVFMVDGVVTTCLHDDPNAAVKYVPSTPEYMIANLAIGPQGSWPGSVTSETPFPANMDIAYIKAYQFNDITPPAVTDAILIKNPAVSDANPAPGETITLSADVVIGPNDLPGPTFTQFIIYNYDGSQVIANPYTFGPDIYKAGQTYHVSVPYSVTSASAATVYTVAVQAMYNNYSQYEWFANTAFPPFTIGTGNTSCGNYASGSTYQVVTGTQNTTAAASVGVCAYGGTQTVQTSTTQTYLCTNGVQTAQGAPVTSTTSVGATTCTAAAACGTHESGTTYTLTSPSVTGSMAATIGQCPYGGTQATTTVTSQAYSCTNGVETAQGRASTQTTNTGNPVCTAPASCGTTASGSIVSQQVSQTSGSAPATLTQCPSTGGTQATQTTVTQAYLCTNGALTAQGGTTSQTVNVGAPVCTAAADTLILNLSEDYYQANAQFIAYVDGIQLNQATDVTVHQPTGKTQAFRFTGHWGAGQHVLVVQFPNDAWDGTSTADGHDRNLFVNSITYNGVTQTPNDEIYSPGTRQYYVSGTPVTKDRLVLKLSEDYYQGNAQFIAYLDGWELNPATDVTVHHSSGKDQTFSFTGQWGKGKHLLVVQFPNDAWDSAGSGDGHDRNLYVDQFSYDGVVQNPNIIMWNTGTTQFGIPATN